jgi:hypothetical protein
MKSDEEDLFFADFGAPRPRYTAPNEDDEIASVRKYACA